ncbi:BTB/POZ domain-containing protein At3g50780-like [Panicum virgatum]|uniref:BTB/POZ domain-containing protein At3g50780-like n=1 Tax=Panicum virgatum TaxID=38727 RepID=UPI0019D5DD8C|nr:BTB/POZ domain-containing protein At3g50780-like [Panicum virgatum]
MYCDEAKHRLLKQSLPRVLRIMKVAEVLGFHGCVKSCLEYLEAVPWVGEEEDNVVASIRRLQSKDYGVIPLLRRISSKNLLGVARGRAALRGAGAQQRLGARRQRGAAAHSGAGAPQHLLPLIFFCFLFNLQW